jgi:hypothetical protein
VQIIVFDELTDRLGIALKVKETVLDEIVHPTLSNFTE